MTETTWTDLPAEIAAAERRIRAHVRETPLEASALLAERIGGDVAVKLENLQVTGSFKVRGALNKVLSLPDDGRPIVTASTGNHGAGVAHALRTVGRSGIVFVPEGASETKVASIRRLGAEVRAHGRDSIETERHVRHLAQAGHGVFVPPYNDRHVVAGQGTIALEILRQAPRIDHVFVAVGGGGLIAGIAAGLKAQHPGIRVYGCSPAASCVMAQSVRAGRVLDLPSQPTLSDATAGGVEADSITFGYCRDLVDAWVEVSEAEIVAAMRLFIDAHHMMIEGASGVAIAAAIKTGAGAMTGTSVIVSCGANISRATLKAVL